MGLLREASSRENSLTVIIVVLAILFVSVYTLVFPRHSGTELFLVPDASANLLEDRNEALTPGGRFFVLGDREGYWDASGKLLRSLPRRPQAVADGQQMAWYDAQADRVVIEGVKGTLGTIAGQKYPFWSKGNVLTMDENRLGLASYTTAGALRWSRKFSSVITAVDSSATATVVGTLDGKVQVFDVKGLSAGPFVPGGSRLAVVFNVAMSPDARYLLTLAGVDPKRLLVLEKGSSDYRPVFHKPLTESKPWPTPLGFFADGRLSYHEVEGALSLQRVDQGDRETLLPLSGTLLDVKEVPRQNLVALISGSQGRQVLTIDSLEGRSVLVANYQANQTFVQPQGGLLILGLDQSLLTLEMRSR